MFFVERRVGFSEIGPDCKIKLTDMLDYFQDAVINQSEDLGVGVSRLTEEGYCWVLSSWQVVVDRYPNLYEKVIIGTGPHAFKGFMGMRNFIMKTEDGEVLARANSVWSFIDFKQQTLARIPEYVIAPYHLIDKIEMEYAPRKVKIPSIEKKTGDVIKAEYHTLDSNNHVNNAQYISIAEDLVPEGRRAGQMRAEYRVSAHAGDIIVPEIYRDEENGIYTVSLNDTDGNVYAIVEFSDIKDN